MGKRGRVEIPDASASRKKYVARESTRADNRNFARRCARRVKHPLHIILTNRSKKDTRHGLPKNVSKTAVEKTGRREAKHKTRGGGAVGMMTHHVLRDREGRRVVRGRVLVEDDMSQVRGEWGRLLRVLVQIWRALAVLVVRLRGLRENGEEAEAEGAGEREREHGHERNGRRRTRHPK